uniref:Uncharacterized protein n=1 Tax=Anopheles arabiensis TaxID=7173 RepID=A0A182HXY0_ANOAR
MHPEHQLKLFCTTCHQMTCGEYSTLLHRDHRCTTREPDGQGNDFTIRKNNHCVEVYAFVDEYVAALKEHRCMLIKQSGNIRQTKMDFVKC